MKSVQHKRRAEELLAEVEALVDSQATVRRPLVEAQTFQLAALVSYAQIHAHALLALYPDGSQPIATVKTF